MDLFCLKGKVAIVTGAGQGLGLGMAEALAKAGADIVNIDYSAQNIEISREKIEKLGVRYHGIVADLINSNVENLKNYIAESVQKMGHVDILVNNAGIIRREDALQFNEKDWDDVMNINLKNVFFLCQAFANQIILQKTSGKIINVASMLSYQGGIRVPSYTASKSGIRGITMLMANEWSKLGIHVNAIAPGYMATLNTKPIRDDETRAGEILERIPLQRWGTPEDLAGPVVFLASSASDYVQGYVLAVDGGWLAR